MGREGETKVCINGPGHVTIKFKHLLYNLMTNKEHTWVGETSVYLGYMGHISQMTDMPIYGENSFKRVILDNQRANDPVAWNIVMVHWAHHCLQIMTIG